MAEPTVPLTPHRKPTAPALFGGTGAEAVTEEGDTMQALQIMVNALLLGVVAVLIFNVRRLNLLTRGQAEINQILADRISVEAEARKLGDRR